MRKGWTSALIALALAACNEANPTGPDAFDASFTAAPAYGGVYTATNQAANEILQYRRSADGTLAFVAAFSTGGTGTGAGLGNQGGVTLSGNGRWLFTVNAASNEVVVFRRGADGSLTRTDVASSHGETPISVTQHGTSVYVLNTGGDGNIAGFRLSGNGTLAPLGTQPLSQTGGVAGAQVEFSPNGRFLVVTEKNTNRIVVYPVHAGVAGAPIAQDSDGQTPFGFAFRGDGTLIVSNAAGGGAGLGTATSYGIGSDGMLHVISSQVPDFQSAPCWFVVTRNGKFAYTTNTATNNTSGYAVGPSGGLTLLGNGDTASNDGGPIDATINPSGAEFLHILNATGVIEIFSIGADGALEFVSDVSGLPAGTNGLAAY